MTEDATVSVARPDERQREQSLERLLVFSLNQEDYAVPLLKVKEVMALPEITPLPQTPSYFKGIMNLRGLIVPIIDLRLKFKLPMSDISSETVVIIVDMNPYSLGVIVDAVDCVMAVETENIKPPPQMGTQLKADYIAGISEKDKKLVLLLDVERSLSDIDLNLIKNNLTA